MANNERVPAPLDCTDLANDWSTWKRSFMVYMIASGKSAETEATKIATFIWLIGAQASNIYNSLFPNDGTEESLLGTQRIGHIVPADEENNIAAHVEQVVVQRTLNDVLQRFDEHCIPQKNVTMESYVFNTTVQKEKESFGEFETRLRTQIRRCDYICTCGVSYEDRMLRDQIIIGVSNKQLQTKLIDGHNYTLAIVTEKCKSFEATSANKNLLERKTTISTIITSDEPAVHTINRFCFNCGETWTPKHVESCKAKGQTCKCCGKTGHFQRMCRRKTHNNNNNGSVNNARRNVSALNWADQGKSLDNNKMLTRTHSNKNHKFNFRINSVKSKWTKEYMHCR